MKPENLPKKLSAIDFSRKDVATKKLNRMIIGNPMLAEDIIRHYKVETGAAMQLTSKTVNAVPGNVRAGLYRFVRDGLCLLPPLAA